MATASLISIDEYLHTSYEPDCDFVDGQIEERNLGEYEHGVVQTILAAWFRQNRRNWNVRAIVELRTRVSPTRVRIPDLSVLRRDAPREQVTVTPPLLCIEVLSPEDRLSRKAKALDDFATMGVEHLWVIDPLRRIAYTYSNGEFKLAGDRLTIPETEIYLDLPTLFAELDE